MLYEQKLFQKTRNVNKYEFSLFKLQYERRNGFEIKLSRFLFQQACWTRKQNLLKEIIVMHFIETLQSNSYRYAFILIQMFDVNGITWGKNGHDSNKFA
jgi:hypothetical protein